MRNRHIERHLNKLKKKAGSNTSPPRIAPSSSAKFPASDLTPPTAAIIIPMSSRSHDANSESPNSPDDIIDSKVCQYNSGMQGESITAQNKAANIQSHVAHHSPNYQESSPPINRVSFPIQAHGEGNANVLPDRHPPSTTNEQRRDEGLPVNDGPGCPSAPFITPEIRKLILTEYLMVLFNDSLLNLVGSQLPNGCGESTSYNRCTLGVSQPFLQRISDTVSHSPSIDYPKWHS